MKISSVLKILFLCMFLGLFTTCFVHAKRDKAITGTWVVNEEATETLQNKVRRTNTRSMGDGPNVAVLGVPAGGAGPSGPNSTLKFPIVLECEEISFQVDDEKVKASCETGVSREFLVGKLHGRITRFRSNVLTESYSSTSRSVKHDIRVDKEGNLVAKVRIKPKNGIAQVYVRVYSRPLDSESQETDNKSEDITEDS